MPWFIRYSRAWWCLLPLFALSYPVHAAPDIEVASAEQTDVIETREVVVSATKTPVPVTQLTSAVEVITGEQMQERKLRAV
ncbi:MAG TPA: Vitamin B12 transporter BtuB, partial [Nitrospiraceae bacterium]|nr:Vitamin B12 transporter BtuB [Nitrospiraceae bacterium]